MACLYCNLFMHIDDVFLSVHLSVYLSLSVCLSVYLYLFVCLSVYLYLSLCLSVYVYLSVYLYLSLCLSEYLSLSVSLYQTPTPEQVLETYLSRSNPFAIKVNQDTTHLALIATQGHCYFLVLQKAKFLKIQRIIFILFQEINNLFQKHSIFFYLNKNNIISKN